MVVRENTEGLYSGREHEVVDGVVEALKIVTRAASERIMRFAFEYARHHGRKRLCVLHKASVMRLSDGLFLECARSIAQDYPYLEVEFRAIDTVFLELVLDPSRYDMLVSGNLDGDLLSDLCAGFVGGLGVVPGANLGDGCAVFEAVHGTRPRSPARTWRTRWRSSCRPSSCCGTSARRPRPRGLRRGVETLLAEGRSLTRDLGGQATTTEMTEALLALIERDGGRSDAPRH